MNTTNPTARVRAHWDRADNEIIKQAKVTDIFQSISKASPGVSFGEVVRRVKLTLPPKGQPFVHPVLKLSLPAR